MWKIVTLTNREIEKKLYMYYFSLMKLIDVYVTVGEH